MILIKDKWNQLIAYCYDEEYARLYLEKYLESNDFKSEFTLEIKPDDFPVDHELELVQLTSDIICTVWESKVWEETLLIEHCHIQYTMENLVRSRLKSIGKEPTDEMIQLCLVRTLGLKNTLMICNYDFWLSFHRDETLKELTSDRMMVNTLHQLNEDYLRKLYNEKE